jgi:hypothetical protein
LSLLQFPCALYFESSNTKYAVFTTFPFHHRRSLRRKSREKEPNHFPELAVQMLVDIWEISYVVQKGGERRGRKLSQSTKWKWLVRGGGGLAARKVVGRNGKNQLRFAYKEQMEKKRKE